MTTTVFRQTMVLSVVWVHGALAETTQEAISIFRNHTQSSWMQQINDQTEAVARDPASSVSDTPNLMLENASDSQHRDQLQHFYQNNDFDGLQTYGEQHSKRLETEHSASGEAWRLLNQSPERYYPDANEHRILGAMELSIKALEHPATWSKQASLPLNEPSEMSATIALFRKHFKDCDYHKTLVLKPGRNVHSPDIRECTRIMVTDKTVTLHRNVEVSPLLEVVSISGLAGVSPCGNRTDTQGCLQIRLGKNRNADNYYHCDCCIREESIVIRFLTSEAIQHAVIHEARWDDRMQIWLNNQKLWQSNGDFPPESGHNCELGRNAYLQSPVPVQTTSFNKGSEHLFKIRTSVGDEGEGYALVQLLYDMNSLVQKDSWSPAAGYEQFQKMQRWQHDGMCQLSYECIEYFAKEDISVHGQSVPLKPTLTSAISDLCKSVRIIAQCDYYKTAATPSPTDHCSQFANNPDCEFLDSECLGVKNGTCYTRQERYDCGYSSSLNRIGIEESMECQGQPMQCMLGECKTNITEADNSDFASAVSGLHAAKHLSHDVQCNEEHGEHGDCRVFSGKPCTCKQGIFNMVDCCNLPTDVNFASYMNLLLMGYLFDKSAIHLQSNYPNHLTGGYQVFRESVAKGINQLSQPAKNLWSDMASYMKSGWNKLTEKLWPTPAEVHVQTASAKPIAGELTSEAQKSLLGSMQQQLFRKMAEVVHQTLGENATNLLFRTAGNGMAAQGGQLSQQALIMNPAITSAISAVTMVYTAYTMTKLVIQITHKCESDEFELAAKREMKTCHKVGSYRKSKLLGLTDMEYNSYCCFNSPLSRILQVQIRQQLSIGWGAANEPDCSGLSADSLQAVDWNRIDLGEWLALLKLQNKLPELHTDTLKQLNLEALTGKGSRLDIDQQREDSLDRLKARHQELTTETTNDYMSEQTLMLRNQSLK